MSKYQCPDSCNKCGGSNNELLNGNPFNPDSSGETATKCQDCGFEDYWAFGFFESSQEMVSKAKTYSFNDEVSE